MVMESGPCVVTVAPGPAEVLVVVVLCGPEVVVVEVVEDTSGWPSSARWSAIVADRTNTTRRCCLRHAPLEIDVLAKLIALSLGRAG